MQPAFTQTRSPERDREHRAQLVDRMDANPLAHLDRQILEVMPARTAPRIFSLSPPIGRTRPERVISPVMARSWRTGRPERTDTTAEAMVTPAEGPSLGMAPAGT